MKPIRVLIADGSANARRTISRVLARDPEIDVVGSCSNGQTVLANATETKPDVIVLEVELPELNGLQTLTELRKRDRNVPVVMFSRQTSRGSNATVESLMHGATAYVTKPANDADLERCVAVELTGKIKQLVSGETSALPRKQAIAGRSDHPQSPASRIGDNSIDLSSAPAELVAIAASTGGPAALGSVLAALPPSFSVPIVIVQHMPQGFTQALAQSLTRQAGLDVREIETSSPIAAARVWLARGGQHLVLQRQGFDVCVAAQTGPPENDCCPSADVLFRSAVEVYGARALAVVLTGMGCDGLAGCRTIRGAGGTVITQDEASSIAWGMPGQVTTAGLADVVLPLDQIASEIVRRTSDRATARRRERGVP